MIKQCFMLWFSADKNLHGTNKGADMQQKWATCLIWNRIIRLELWMGWICPPADTYALSCCLCWWHYLLHCSPFFRKQDIFTYWKGLLCIQEFYSWFESELWRTNIEVTILLELFGSVRTWEYLTTASCIWNEMFCSGDFEKTELTSWTCFLSMTHWLTTTLSERLYCLNKEQKYLVVSSRLDLSECWL